MIEEATLDLMWRQSLLMSLGCLLLLGLRPLMLKRVGAQVAYASWLLIPLLLLTTILPRPAQEPLRVVLQQSALPGLAKAAVSAPATSELNRQAVCALWAAGALAVALVQWRRQRRFEALIGPQDGRLPAASSPALLGLWRARLALPQDFEQRFDADEQTLILAHEGVHLSRNDNAWNLVACALCALHWFNPLAWLAWRRMRADQELSCDAAVLRAHPQQTSTYARALAKTAPMTSPFAVTASAWHSRQHPLIERVAMLKLHNSRRAFGTNITALTALLFAGATYAVQAEAPVDKKVEILLTIRQSDGSVIAKPRLIAALGQTASVRLGDAESAWQIDLTTTEMADGRLKVRSKLTVGTPGKEIGSETEFVTSGEMRQHDYSASADRASGGVNLTGDMVISSPAIKNSPLAIDRVVRLLK